MRTPVKLLYLEDDEVDQRAFLRMVREKGLPYELELVRSLAEARAQMAQSCFDAIVADYHLPDGYCTELLDEARDTPFILLTGTLEEQLALRTLEHGADDYLPKDSQQRYLEALPFALEKALYRHRSREKELRLTQQLRESERNLRMQVELIALSHDAVIVRRLGGEIVSWNQGAERIYGWQAEEVLGRRTHELLETRIPDLGAGGAAVDEALAKEGKWEGELCHRRRDGVVLAIHSRQVISRASHGSAQLILETNRDITEREQAEETLREAEMRLRLASEATGLGAFDYYPQSGKFIWSDRAKQHFGLRPEAEVSSETFLKGLHPADRDRVEQTVQDVFRPEKGGVYRTEYRTIGLDDGKERWLEAFGRVYFDDQGKPVRLVGATLDITERKHDQEALRSSEERFRVFMDNTSAIAWAKDEAGRYVYFNQAYQRQFGMAFEDYQGKTDFELWPEENARQFRENDLKVLRSGEPAEVLEETTTPAGDKRYWLNVKFPFQDASGAKYIGGIGIDITQRKQAEALLKTVLRTVELERSRLAAVLEALPTGVAIADRTGKVTQFNAALTRIWGAPPVPKNAADYGRWRGRWADTGKPLAAEDWAMARAIRTGEIVSGDVIEIEKFDGSGCATIINAAAPIRDHTGRIIGGVVAEVDITAQKRAEEALRAAKEELARANEELERRVNERTAKLQEAMAELEQLSYSMIHDMRAPLRAVQSFGGILEEDSESHLSTEGRDLVAKMRTATKRMDRLVVDVLNYSRVLRGELPLEPVDVGELVRGIVETYPNLGPDKAEVQVIPNLPVVVGHPAALTQCLAQLIGNAVKFAKPGQKATVEVQAEQRDDGWVRVVVEDNGIGIAPEFQNKVFGMFQRLSNPGEGTGMGLAIVKKATERMGGRVGVESEPGKGSRFWIELKSAA
ncbi:MAG TPA: PAS domain S-box protein [Clostridia bacterium]|nr:PAS domain S-box protein [Clostridia bacterium]